MKSTKIARDQVGDVTVKTVRVQARGWAYYETRVLNAGLWTVAADYREPQAAMTGHRATVEQYQAAR